jgi:DNA polymerase III sliding clamp (beta) subunit (PCNA family)
VGKVVKFTIDKNALSTSLEYCAKTLVAANKSSEIHYKCIEFIYDAKDLLLLSYDGMNACRVLYNEQLDAKEVFNFTVEYSVLQSSLSLSDDATCEFSIEETKLVIGKGKNRFTIPLITGSSSSGYWSLIQEKEVLIPSISIEDILNVFTFVSPCLSSMENGALNGVLYDGNFASTIKSSFALYSENCNNTNRAVFLSASMFSTLSKLKDKSAVCNISVTDSLVIVDFVNVQYMFRVLNNIFPKYHGVLETVNNFSFAVAMRTKNLLEAFKSLMAFTGISRRNAIKLTFLNNECTLEAVFEGKQGIKVIEFDDVLFNEEVSFFVNGKNIILYLSNFSSEYSVISFGKDSNVFALYSLDTPSNKYIESKLI